MNINGLAGKVISLKG